MKARTAARELALFVLFQQDGKGQPVNCDKLATAETVVETVRSLEAMAEEQLEAVADEIRQLKEWIIDYEVDHPDNENVPIELPTRPVPIPTSREMLSRLETMLTAVNQLEEALYVPELKALAQREDVQNYCRMLVNSVQNNQAEIDRLIDEAAKDWRVERLQKMDHLLLRLAIGELRYGGNVDAATVVNESMELAKRFTTEESRKFIHGVIGGVSNLTGVSENV